MSEHNGVPIEWEFKHFCKNWKKAVIVCRCGDRSAEWYLTREQVIDCVNRYGELPAFTEGLKGFDHV